MVVVIADAGPLIALAKIKHLHLLEDLFSEIYKMNLSNFKDSLPSKFDEAIKSYLKIK